MIIIYDFDGTLTPYSLPQYEILLKCGYTNEKLMKRVKEEEKVLGMYEAYYRCYVDIFRETGIELSRDNICLGARNVVFNKGVIEYFKKFQSSKTGIKHYIVTSGLKDYVDETPIAQFVDGIFGVTFKQENGTCGDIDFLLTDKEKVEIIKKIQKENKGTNDIIYFGDGMTDSYAFEYVHSIGGKNVFIVANENVRENYQKLNVNNIIDKCFDADFGIDSEISKFII